MKCLKQVWEYFLTIHASLLFIDGGSSSSFCLACIDGKTQTPISSFSKSRFKFTSVFNGLWKSSGAKYLEHKEEVFPGTHIFLLSNMNVTHFHLFFLIGHHRKMEFYALIYSYLGPLRCHNALQRISQAFSAI